MNMEKRVAREINELQSTIPEAIIIREGDSYNISFPAPVDSVYDGITVHMIVSYPNDYPFTFMTVLVPKLRHPNVDPEFGILRLSDIFDWNPALSISKVILTFMSLLHEPHTLYGTCADPVALREWKTDVHAYRQSIVEFSK